jgi:hypothetical protein
MNEQGRRPPRLPKELRGLEGSELEDILRIDKDQF